MVRDHGGDGEIVVPPTIHALLQARIDSLDGDVRVVMERGSVEGEVFHRGAVAVLSPRSRATGVESHLATLVRKELIRSTPPTFPEDEGFRFRHLLIRDAAYESLPKSTRAELHERFAEWLATHDLVERDEIVGYHLEQAHRYRVGARSGGRGALGARTPRSRSSRVGRTGRDGSRRLECRARPAPTGSRSSAGGLGRARSARAGPRAHAPGDRRERRGGSCGRGSGKRSGSGHPRAGCGGTRGCELLRRTDVTVRRPRRRRRGAGDPRGGR